MLLVFSAIGFGLALALFFYLFDSFMGASDTSQLSSTISSINDPDAMRIELKSKTHKAAGNRS